MDDLFSVSTTEKREKKKINENIPNDMFSNDIGFKKEVKEKIKNKKKKKNNHIYIYIIAFICICTIVLGIYFYIKKDNIPAKKYIIENIQKVDFFKKLRIEEFKTLTNNLNSKAYEITSSGKIDPKFLSKENTLENNEQNNKDQKEKNSKEEKNKEDKLKIKDLDFVFKGSINNKEQNKSSLVNTSIIWNKTNITSWNIFENKDLILIEAPEYFKEMISIKKDSLDKVFTSDSSILETYKEVNMSKDENIFEELIMLKNCIKKSTISSLEKMSKQNFSVEKRISTTYRNQKEYADNYKITVDNIAINVIIENMLKDIKTDLKVDALRYKSLSSKEKEIENIIKKLKPNMKDTDKLEIIMYRIKGNVPKIEASIKSRTGETSKIFQMEIIEDKKKDKFELITIFGDTKIKVNKEKERDKYIYKIDFETLKNNLSNIKPNEIKIDGKKKDQKQDENQNQNINNISFKANKINLMSENIKEEQVVEKPKNIDRIISAKDEEKVFFKVEFSVPENSLANNMRFDLNIYSSFIDLDLAIKIGFKEMLVMEMMEGDRVELDALSESELKAMYKNLIEPTIISVTAKKLDEISKQKQATINSNKESTYTKDKKEKEDDEKNKVNVTENKE